MSRMLWIGRSALHSSRQSLAAFSSAPRTLRSFASALEPEQPEAAGAALFDAWAARVARGELEEDSTQRRAAELLAAGLGRAAGNSAAAGPDAQPLGRESWVMPVRTVGTAAAAAAEEDRRRAAEWTNRLAKENRQRVRRQRHKVSSDASAASTSQAAASTASAEQAPVKAAAEAAATVKAADAQQSAAASAPSMEAAAKPKRPARHSIYMHGPVGTGKTMLLDLFFRHAKQAGLRVRRQHFYEFMLDLHSRIHQLEEQSPVEVAANALADEVDVLCFDEFQVTDIQDAVILPRLFEILFLRGMVIVMTSNTTPALLYSGGLNRHVHLPPFIGLLTDHCTVLRLGGIAQRVDYRRRAEAAELAKAAATAADTDAGVPADDGSESALGAYLCCGTEAEANLEQRWSQLLEGHESAALELKLPMGRRFKISQVAGNMCFVSFTELCGTDRGEADFLALADRFSTVLVSGVPSFASLEAVDELRRFVKLLDVFYDRRVRIVLAAAAPLDDLFKGIRGDVQEGDLMWRTALYSADGKAGMAPGAVGTVCEAIQATERAESRLREMRTRRYWNEGREASAAM
mmetsp:Transcript_83529/g.145199  ORF Transcript_83529/g.145199 Transcript_83529/m.145199 type:complete len:577 (+) Transcript_83529:168-1898(+)